jgi:hypothetical protein
MVERRDRARLTLEPVAEGDCGNLDGDIAVQPRVRRTVHLAHATFTDAFDDLVRSEGRPWCKGHWIVRDFTLSEPFSLKG